MEVKFQFIPHVQKASVPFQTTVSIKNATAGATISVRLRQMVGGTFSASQNLTADANGVASAPFTVTLSNPGTVFLAADATDAANTDFGADSESAQVVP
jgi:hypothetical protein